MARILSYRFKLGMYGFYQNVSQVKLRLDRKYVYSLKLRKLKTNIYSIFQLDLLERDKHIKCVEKRYAYGKNKTVLYFRITKISNIPKMGPMKF